MNDRSVFIMGIAVGMSIATVVILVAFAVAKVVVS